VVFAASVAGSIALTASAPNSDASTAKISHYVLTHKGQFGGSAILTGLGVITGIAFALYLRAYFRRFVPEWMNGTTQPGRLRRHPHLRSRWHPTTPSTARRPCAACTYGTEHWINRRR